MNYILDEWKTETQKISYRPYYLAVDEFAIRKGHQYATCVMDLVRGDILWVGKGRSIKDFNKFFETFNGTDYLSSVKAVAMDMNASYNTLVKQYLPQAEIVYDRYHVQAQFGRDVL
jgi:transposase